MTTTTRVVVDLESAVGPRVLAVTDADAAEIDGEIPEGWTVDYDSQVRTDSGRWSYPLVRA